MAKSKFIEIKEMEKIVKGFEKLKCECFYTDTEERYTIFTPYFYMSIKKENATNFVEMLKNVIKIHNFKEMNFDFNKMINVDNQVYFERVPLNYEYNDIMHNIFYSDEIEQFMFINSKYTDIFKDVFKSDYVKIDSILAKNVKSRLNFNCTYCNDICIDIGIFPVNLNTNRLEKYLKI